MKEYPFCVVKEPCHSGGILLILSNVTAKYKDSYRMKSFVVVLFCVDLVKVPETNLQGPIFFSSAQLVLPTKFPFRIEP